MAYRLFIKWNLVKDIQIQLCKRMNISLFDQNKKLDEFDFLAAVQLD